MALRCPGRVLRRPGQHWCDFLRGTQRTDGAGKATFTTVYPGWYQGRAVHIHFKVRTDPDAYRGFILTSQLFFDDELNRTIFTSRDPYQQKGAQDMTNAPDGIYNQSNGTTLLDCQASGDGYAATFSIASDEAAAPPARRIWSACSWAWSA